MCVEPNTIFKCIHDTIINKELAFNRGKFYYSNNDGKFICGENNKLYNINDFNFNNSFMSILNERVDSKITDFRAYIYDYSILKVLKEEKIVWKISEIYKASRDSGRVISEIPPAVMQEVA